MNDAKHFIRNVRERLTTMIDNRAFRFRGTTRCVAEQYLKARTTLVGFSSEEIAAEEEAARFAIPKCVPRNPDRIRQAIR